MEPVNVVNDICRYYVEDQKGVDPALINHVAGLRRARDYAGLASCSSTFDWHSHTVKEFRFLRQVEALYKKNADLAVDEVCEDAARLSFFEAEEQCSRTNLALKPYVGYVSRIDEPYRSWVERMQRYISNVLGDFDSFLDMLPYLVKVTPGATAHTSRKNSLPQKKLRMAVFATTRARPYVWSLYRMFGFRDPRFKACKSNRVELVPKSWKTHRTIACEPEGNLPVQLAFDTYAKRRLRRYGINLRDQDSNKRGAKEGSIDGRKATIDFSKASDTISYNLVHLLFPVDWAGFLTNVRSPCYRGAFGEGTYSKFSSMGNGSTFCIETLLFAAACYAVGAKDFLVYGDDVILESELCVDYYRLAGFMGFTVNEDKSYTHGPFRESCGGDYFNGIDVTPVYVRKVGRSKAALCHLVNTLASIAMPEGKLAAYLRTIVEDNKLPFVPHQEGTMTGVWIDPAVARARKLLFRVPVKFNRGRLWRCFEDSKRYIPGWVKKKPSTSPHVDYFRAYVPKSTQRRFVDSRGYYLWFLMKNSQVLFSQPWDAAAARVHVTSTSSVPVFQHSYVRKRVCWVPAEAIPDHLYWWSDFVSPPVSNRPNAKD